MPSHGKTRHRICPITSMNQGTDLKAVVKVLLPDTEACVVLFSYRNKEFGMEDILGLSEITIPLTLSQVSKRRLSWILMYRCNLATKKSQWPEVALRDNHCLKLANSYCFIAYPDTHVLPNATRASGPCCCCSW